LLAELVGPNVTLIDTGEAVARQLVRRLPPELVATSTAPTEQFWTTGDARAAQRIMSQLWGRLVAVATL
jgi:glutamate racemase